MDEKTDLLLLPSDYFYDNDYDGMPALMDVSDSDSDDASGCDSDDDVPDLVSVEDIPDAANLKDWTPRPTAPFAYKPGLACDANFRLRGRSTPTPAVLVVACPACDIDKLGLNLHEGNVFRRAEQPTGEYLEWEACTGRLERARTLRRAERYREQTTVLDEELQRLLRFNEQLTGWGVTDGEAPERMWAMSWPSAPSTRAVVPAFVRAKL
ncbi:hypothetical protein DFH06DRAFT_1330094 [Mycena polygramma]|nr:hypothetical protein DFH06DRAFT_1330094 [Mycena polygramma]